MKRYEKKKPFDYWPDKQEGATDFITESNSQQVLLQAQQNKIQASINMMLQKKTIDFFAGR